MDKEDNNIYSINYEDDDRDFNSLSELLDYDTVRKKHKYANEVIENGDYYLSEIDKKKKNRKLRSKKYIPYILEKSDGYTEEELNSYSFEDIIDIYNQVKLDNRPFLLKVFHFLFFNK